MICYDISTRSNKPVRKNGLSKLVFSYLLIMIENFFIYNFTMTSRITQHDILVAFTTI